MELNRDNYEIWFIDYFEGNLNPEEKAQLMHFLTENPDLENEYNEFEKVYMPVSEKTYKFKNQLKKQIRDLGPIDRDTLDEYCIAYLENDLSDTEKENLIQSIGNNQEYKRTFDLYQKTRLPASLAGEYLQKKQLKHFFIEKRTVYRAVSYAAVIAILIFGFILINKKETQQAVPARTAEAISPEKPEEPLQRTDIKEIQTGNEVPIENTINRESLNEPEKDTKPIIGEELTEIRKKTPDVQSELQEKVVEELELITVQPDENTKKSIYEEIALSKEIEEDTAEIDFMPEMKEQMAENISEATDTAVQKTTIQVSDKRRRNLLNIAELGLKLVGKLNERNFDLETNYTSSGQLQSVTLTTEKRKITSPAI